MAAFDHAARLQRLEQQLDAFERLHGDELRDLQRRLEAYQRLQEDEVRLLREKIAELRAALGGAVGPRQPLDLGQSATSAEPSTPAAGAATSALSLGQASAPASRADNPEATQAAIEEVVETSLEQAVSRRELFGGRRPDGED